MASFSLKRSSVDSISLRERKTDHRNGITLMCTLIGGRYDEQATRPYVHEGGIAEEANASGKARGYANVGTITEKKGAQRVWQRRRHPRSSKHLILRVRVGTSCPGASSSSMYTASKRESIKLESMATKGQSKSSKSC